MRSAPTVCGSSTSSVMGSGENGPMTIGVVPVASSTPSAMTSVIIGTTEHMTLAVTRVMSRPAWTNRARNSTAHSSVVREGMVVTRQERSSSPAAPSPNRPMVISVLPTSRATSMGRERYGWRRGRARRPANPESAGGFSGRGRRLAYGGLTADDR